MIIPPQRVRQRSKRERQAARDVAVVVRLARRVAILEGVVRSLSDECEALRAIAGGVWVPEEDAP